MIPTQTGGRVPIIAAGYMAGPPQSLPAQQVGRYPADVNTAALPGQYSNGYGQVYAPTPPPQPQMYVDQPTLQGADVNNYYPSTAPPPTPPLSEHYQQQ